MGKNLLVLYHDDLDGFASAYCAWRKNGDEADYMAVNYGQDPPSNFAKYKYVDIVDFSYPRAVLEDMSRKLGGDSKLLVLDHHKTAQGELLGLPFAVFNETRSGCAMAWLNYCMGEVPKIILAVEDRDLWKFERPQTKEICAALDSHPRDFNVWDFYVSLGEGGVKNLIMQGDAILRYMNRLIEAHVRHAKPMIWKDGDGPEFYIPVVNATMLQSEIGSVLSEGQPFSATFFIRPDGKKVWSMRSKDSGVDVAEIARKRGGGGHARAAGFVEEARA